MNESYFNLFSFCKVVKGQNRAIICDFQKENIEFIPLEMAEIIAELKENSIENLEKKYSDDLEIFKSYINFLSQERFGIIHKERLHFKETFTKYKSPEYINNAIIEYSFSNFSLLNILKDLDKLLVKYIELRLDSFELKNITEVINILLFLEKSVCRGITIFFPYTTLDNTKYIVDKISNFNIIRTIYFYGYVKNKIENIYNQEIFFISDSLSDINESIVSSNYLVNNIEYFIEAQYYNPYYYKKISINKHGDIKNCIKNKSIFGNVCVDKIEDVINFTKFTEFWYANHDKILNIKDSELRYNMIVCNDLEKQDNGYFKIV